MVKSNKLMDKPANREWLKGLQGKRISVFDEPIIKGAANAAPFIVDCN